VRFRTGRDALFRAEKRDGHLLAIASSGTQSWRGTIVQKTAHTLVAFVASMVLAATALADSYPVVSGYRFVSGGPFATTKPAVCSAFAALVSGDVHYDADGGDVFQHCGGTSYTLLGSGAFVGETTAAKCHQPQGCEWYVAAVACPYGGSLWNDQCVNAPSCPAGQMRDALTGECGPTKKNKALGPGPACQPGIGASPFVGNPCNAGTGTKFHAETLYAGVAGSPLFEQLSYNSRLLADQGAVVLPNFGMGWRGRYQRGLRLLPTGVVLMRRNTEQGIDFAPPASGNVYVPDADIVDRLERLTDGSGNTTGWKYTVAADDSTELYSSARRLLSITDRAGSTVTLTYSTASTPPSVAPGPDYLISVSDQFQRSLSYFYDSQGLMTHMTDPAGGTYTFARDTNKNLVSITFPDGSVRQFLYNEAANTVGSNLPYSLTGIIDENGGRFATYKYGEQGRVISTEHAGGANKSTLAYTTVFVTTTVTDALNVSRIYGLTTSHGMVRSTGVTGPTCPSCGPAALTHDANGNVASRTDWNGNRANYTYDLTRNVEISRVEGLTSAGAATPQTRTISTQWHSTFRLPTAIAEPLRITTFTYDANGATCGARGALCSKSIQATTDANGSQAFSAAASGSPRTWTYTYNGNGSVLTVNGPRTDVADVTTYTYYANNDATVAKRGNVATITNAAGHVTSITAYNLHGQPLTIVDANGLTTTLTYDVRQRLKTRTVGGELTTYDYDLAGQLTKVTLPDGSFLSYTYDGAHRLTGLQDNLGNKIGYTLDAMGNRTLEEVRDPANALAQTRSRVFSNLNRLFQEIGASSQTTEYTYDDQGNVLTVKDPLNRITTSQYDALNRLKQVTSPSPISAVTQYGYDGRDQLVTVTDPRSLVTGYTVNGLGNLTQEASPDTGTTTSTHDLAGNLLTQTDAKSQTTTYAYDALDRVTSITFHDGSKQNYTYDAGTNGIGRMTGIAELNPSLVTIAQIAYGYDQKGRVTSETRTINAVAYTTAYRYDASGRLDRITYPSGRTVDYTFDSLGRISAVNTTPSGGSAQAIASSITYHPFGGVKGFTFGNSQIYARTYDQDGRIATYTLAGTGYTMGYDVASRISFITETANPPNTNTYGYDDLDRLTSATLPATVYGYSYDAVGNRLTRSASAGTDAYAYSSTSNRIASITPASGPVRSFTLDNNGSTTADGANTYTYDTRGRMLQAVSSLGTTTYQVNALGQRIRKTNSLGDRVFQYDFQGYLIAESTAAGATLREYIWLGDLPVAIVEGNDRFYIHADHLNTPRLVANSSGTPVWRWGQQEPFGVSVPDENPSGLGVFEQPLRFPGQYADKETNLYYNYYRDCYDPALGRYCQSDPIGLEGGLNTYAYVTSSPLSFHDFFGLQNVDPMGLGLTQGSPATFLTMTTFAAAQKGYTISQATQAGGLYRNFTAPMIFAAGSPYVIYASAASVPAVTTTAPVVWECTAPLRTAARIANLIYKGVPPNTLPPYPKVSPPAIIRPAPTGPKNLPGSKPVQ